MGIGQSVAEYLVADDTDNLDNYFVLNDVGLHKWGQRAYQYRTLFTYDDHNSASYPEFVDPDDFYSAMGLPMFTMIANCTFDEM